MNMMDGAPGAQEKAIRFTGTWREYLPIAATNVLLTIVTIGIYRFWATARQRRYLWSRTDLMGDRMEWTGTGKEMFIGFVIVMAVLTPFFLFFQFLFPALVARGQEGAAIAIMAVFYFAILYLVGFAQFRALRYRLSRSWWRGIRGGSDEPGWGYAGQSFWRTIATFFTGWIAWPWAAASLWNRRWNSMSFGPLNFRTELDSEGLWGRWALVYLVPIGGFILAGILSAIVGVGIMASMDAERPPAGLMVIFGLIFFAIYLLIPLMTLSWYAAFYRKAADELKLGNLEFEFDATTWEWLKLFLGNVALAVVTLGFGLAYWGYRNWSFMVRHLHVFGEVDALALTQSTTHAPGEAEGLADAFDIGAI